MHLYRFENIRIRPLLVLARSPDDAANILEHSLRHGMVNRPDADFDVVPWRADWTDYPAPLSKWQKEKKRGLIWLVDDGRGWEMVSAEPKPS